MSWKRAQIQDHKFDFVDENDFIDNSLGRRLAYSSVFLYTLKDLGSIGILIFSNSNAIANFGNKDVKQRFVITSGATNSSSVNDDPIIQAVGGVSVMFMLIVASLICSFLLLAFEWKKANAIIKSRDISYAFTSLIAYRFYTIRSYPYYCFFSQIQNSRKTVDVLAFWVFFKFKGWKRLILAEFPRQFLNAVIIQNIWRTYYAVNNQKLINTIQAMLSSDDKSLPAEGKIFLSLQAITVTIWLISFIGLVVAFILYLPLLCAIRGNLKEYCVHKVDKRIDEILKRKSRKRLQDLKRQEREKIGSEFENQPTLPVIDVDLDSRYDQPRQYANYSSYGNTISEYASDYGSEASYGSRYQHQYPHYQNYNNGYSEPPPRIPRIRDAGNYNPSAEAISRVSEQSIQPTAVSSSSRSGYEATQPSNAPVNNKRNSMYSEPRQSQDGIYDATRDIRVPRHNKQ